jgi:hypothetical protein
MEFQELILEISGGARPADARHNFAGS